VVAAGAALELLQAYLLVHDDWMDDDDVRRGGPSVHAMLRERFGSKHEGDAAAILGGDLGMAMAQSALFEVELPADRLVETARELARIQEDVVFGQLLDNAGSADDVEVMHTLKTGSYTVRGPLLMGAALGGADAKQKDGLARFAQPLGVAFQIRDDLLGTFGDPKATGKPMGNDLRRGKRTQLVLELRKDPAGSRLLDRVLGVDDAPDDEVRAVIERMTASGARARVEDRLGALMQEARRELGMIDISEEARAVLGGAVLALGERDR
jgi:geranylgeranyl diphosphate synthase type I